MSKKQLNSNLNIIDANYKKELGNFLLKLL